MSYSSTYWWLLILVFLMCTSRALPLFFWSDLLHEFAVLQLPWIMSCCHQLFFACEVRLLFQEPSTIWKMIFFSERTHETIMKKEGLATNSIPPIQTVHFSLSLFLQPLLSTDRNRYLLDLRRKLSLPEDQVGSKRGKRGRACLWSLGKVPRTETWYHTVYLICL